MKTVLTALAAWSGCAAAREYWNRSGRRDGDYWKGRVRLRTFWNRGAAFGLPIPPKALPLASAAALCLLWSGRRRCPVGMGLILGGGLSNFWERAREGKVCDYLQFPRAPKPLNRYVYNLADLCIFTGGALCLWRWGKGPS